jgi:Domain of unknown function (DUF4260)
MSATATRFSTRLAWAALFAAALAGAIVLAGAGTWQIWVLFVAPDLALLTVTRSVGPYNALHSVPGPVILIAAALALASPAWVAGGLAWLAHIAMDRAVGYGLRNPDGSQRA